jgi:hypothetical protein
MINEAVADNPGLASQIGRGLAGRRDPATQSITTAQYLIRGAEALRNSGISDPTVLDVRAVYNFGPTDGVALATADPDVTMADVMPKAYARTFAKNGVTPRDCRKMASLCARKNRECCEPGRPGGKISGSQYNAVLRFRQTGMKQHIWSPLRGSLDARIGPSLVAPNGDVRSRLDNVGNVLQKRLSAANRRSRQS